MTKTKIIQIVKGDGPLYGLDYNGNIYVWRIKRELVSGGVGGGGFDSSPVYNTIQGWELLPDEIK